VLRTRLHAKAARAAYMGGPVPPPRIQDPSSTGTLSGARGKQRTTPSAYSAQHQCLRGTGAGQVHGPSVNRESSAIDTQPYVHACTRAWPKCPQMRRSQPARSLRQAQYPHLACCPPARMAAPQQAPHVRMGPRSATAAPGSWRRAPQAKWCRHAWTCASTARVVPRRYRHPSVGHQREAAVLCLS
jgi:hypothetical protein